jgi:hypothetical protein
MPHTARLCGNDLPSRRSKESTSSTASARTAASKDGDGGGRRPEGRHAWCAARRCSSARKLQDRGRAYSGRRRRHLPGLPIGRQDAQRVSEGL